MRAVMSVSARLTSQRPFSHTSRVDGTNMVAEFIGEKGTALTFPPVPIARWILASSVRTDAVMAELSVWSAWVVWVTKVATTAEKRPA